MQGEFLQQMKGLAEYLRAENKDREVKLKEQKVNISAQRIAQAFEDLGPETDAKSVRKLTFDLVEDAAGLNALKENMPLISSMYSSSLAFLEQMKQEKEDAVLGDYLKSVGAPVRDGVSSKTNMAIYGIEKQGERSVPSVSESGAKALKIYDIRGNLTQTIDTDPRTYAQEWEQKKKELEFQYRKQLENTIAAMNQRAELKATADIFDTKELQSRQKSYEGVKSKVYSELVSQATTLMDVWRRDENTKRELDARVNQKGEKANDWERFKALTQEDKMVLWNKMTHKQGSNKVLEGDELVQAHAKQKLYTQLKAELMGKADDYSFYDAASQDVGQRIVYLDQMAANKLVEGDVQEGWNKIQQAFTAPNADRGIVADLKKTELGSKAKQDMSIKEWKAWFESLNSINKLSVIGALKKNKTFWDIK